jgi:hypothetical protein
MLEVKVTRVSWPSWRECGEGLHVVASSYQRVPDAFGGKLV